MNDKLLYKRFPHIFILLVVVVNIFFIFIIERIDLAQRALVISIPVLVSATIVNQVFKSGKFDSKIKDLLIKSKEKITIDNRILVLLFFYLYLLSVFILYYFDKRPVIYFVVVTVLYLILILEIFSKKSRTNLIILQNILLFLNIVWGVTMRYPLYFGGTDIIAHLNHTELIYISGEISPLQHIGTSYANFPLYHIFLAQSSFVSGQSIILSKNLFTGIIFSLSLVLVYKLADFIFKNEKVSLLCMVFYSSFSIVINHGMYMVTRTMAFIGFLFLVYILFRFKNNEYTFQYVSMVSLFALFILLAHQVSIFQFLLLLFILYSIQYLYNEYYLHGRELLFLCVVTATYWLFMAYSFSAHVIQNILLAPIEEATEAIRPGITTFNVLPYLINNLETSIFIFIFLIGILCVLYYSNKAKIKVFLLFTLIAAIFFIPSPLDVHEATRDIFTFQRVRLFVAPFMGVGIGLGFYLIYNRFSNLQYSSKHKLKRNTYSTAVLFLIVVFIFFSVLSPSISTDTDFHEDNPSRYFDESEMATFSFVSENVGSSSFIQSDRFVVRYFKLGSRNVADLENVDRPYHKQRAINNVSELTTLDDYHYVIYRQGEFYDKNVLPLGYGPTTFTYPRTEENQLELEKSLEKNNKIYTNGNNHIYG